MFWKRFISVFIARREEMRVAEMAKEAGFLVCFVRVAEDCFGFGRR